MQKQTKFKPEEWEAETLGKTANGTVRRYAEGCVSINIEHRDGESQSIPFNAYDLGELLLIATGGNVWKAFDTLESASKSIKKVDKKPGEGNPS